MCGDTGRLALNLSESLAGDDDREETRLSPEQIDSALLAAHNIARALGFLGRAVAWIAFTLVIYPWLGGFASHTKREVGS